MQATSNKKTNKSRIREKYFSILHTLLSAMHDLCLIIYHSTQEGQRGKAKMAKKGKGQAQKGARGKVKKGQGQKGARRKVKKGQGQKGEIGSLCTL